jgi:hypothetical protein
LQQREKAIDLVKYYADWFYAPVDEELENKLYFLDEDEKLENNDYFYKNLKKIYLESNKECGINKI